MNSKRLFGMIISLMLAFNSYSSTISKWEIQGKVVEDQTAVPLPYVTITLNMKSDSSMVTGTISDENGIFKFKKILQGDYFIVCRFTGFEDFYVSDIKPKDGDELIELGDLIMKQAATLLEEVVVKAKTTPLSNSIDKQIIRPDKNISASGGTAVDALRISPSIEVGVDGLVKLRASSKFIILINGKPTTQDANDVLKQISANQINTIEIITNPSVKYRAEGGAGIINIILKKGVRSGLNGRISSTLGTKQKYGSDATFNWNKEKFNFSAGIEWRDFTRTGTQNYDKILVKQDTSSYGFMDQQRIMRDANFGIRLGLDYNPNEQNNFNYAFHSGFMENEIDIDVLTYGYTVPESVDQQFVSSFYFLQKPAFYTNNLGYSRKSPDQASQFSANVYYSYIDYYLLTSQKMAIANTDFEIIDNNPYLQDIVNENNSNDLRLNLDYEQSLNEQFKIELGGGVHSYLRDIDVTYAQFNYEWDTWINNPEFTNRYDFEENIYSAYANVKGNYKGIQMSFGLRGEYMDRFLHQKTIKEGYDYQKLNWFPGFSFSKLFQEVHNVGIAMSNRINRPDEYLMNPFPEFEDNYFYSEGNPNLIPEIVRNIELSYQYAAQKMVLSTNLYYQQTTNKIEQLLIERKDDKLGTTYHNDVNDKAVGLELMGNININNWWSLNASTKGYHYHISGTVLDEEISKDNFLWTTQMVNSFQLGKSTSIQLINYYQSKTQSLQYEISHFHFMDAAVKHELLNGKLALSLQMKDIFRSMNYQLNTTAQQTKLIGDFGNESPIILLNASFQISTYKKRTKDVETEFDM